jgi:predicted trehalose synthase
VATGSGAESSAVFDQLARLLGRRTADLHKALGVTVPLRRPSFAPEPFTQLWQRSLLQDMRTSVRVTLSMLRHESGAIPLEVDLDTFGEDLAAALDRFGPLRVRKFDACRIRVHAMLAEYLTCMDGTGLLPSDAGDTHLLLDWNLVSKCLYEIRYELTPTARPGCRGLWRR